MFLSLFFYLREKGKKNWFLSFVFFLFFFFSFFFFFFLFFSVFLLSFSRFSIPPQIEQKILKKKNLFPPPKKRRNYPLKSPINALLPPHSDCTLHQLTPTGEAQLLYPNWVICVGSALIAPSNVPHQQRLAAHGAMRTILFSGDGSKALPSCVYSMVYDLFGEGV